ncbi:MAG: glycoside hydrolase family 25 protein [Frankiaceae bacterium]|nr:glycoside hydrolase family 25 protein [Frankiaceae bacterium]
MRPLRLVVQLACAAVLAGIVLPAAASEGPLDGPDVARYQHPDGARIDWHRVADSGARFAFVKATEGTTYTNPYFADDYADARDAGLARSAYHYARPKTDLKTARDQAAFFVRTAGVADKKGDLPLVLDIEQSGGLAPARLIAWTHAFVDEATALTKRPVIIYTYPYFWQHYMADTTDFAELPLWIASYRSGGPKEPLPGGWTSWTFWQYTASGRIPGIQAAVDRSRFAGTEEELEALADPTPPTPEPSPTAPFPVPLPTLSPLR